MTPIITLSQTTDTPARREMAPGAAITCLYARSRDSREADAPGQDFIAYGYDEGHIAFAVCDGVSQSFFGDLAARFLGERLVDWLAALLDDPDDAVTLEAFGARLDQALRAWTAEANARVAAMPISEGLPPLVREALARKRDHGSEAMFVAGLVDMARGQVLLGWLGDMGLRLWDWHGAPVELPGAVWETRERWSSRVGPKPGAPRVALVPLAGVSRIAAFSDGLGSRASELDALSLDGLDALARELDAAPASDDISILDIALSAVPVAAGEPIPAPRLFQAEPTVAEAVPVLAAPPTHAPIPEAVARPIAIQPPHEVFQTTPVMILSLLLALILSIGWILLNAQR